MTNKYAGRSTYRYRLVRAEFLRRCKQADAPCWLCQRSINYELPFQHPEAFNADHAIPISVRPDLAEDIAVLRPSHKSCNERRGNEEPFLDIGVPSEVW